MNRMYQTLTALESPHFKKIQKRMHEQDNRATGHPMYLVQQKRILSDEDDSIYVFVQVFFTDKGAQDYIDNNEHNLLEPRIYIASGNANPEWKLIRKILRGDSNDV